MLEFNAPVHGTWNIVHIGMAVPESHQIYVCAVNCMRGVVMTALEMGARDRFSCVTIEEKDMFSDNLETLTIEGVCEVIEKLDKHPRNIMVFTVCVHAFMGANLKKIYDELSKRYPDIDFCRCYMDPIMQKNGPSPDMKLRYAMFEPLVPLDIKRNTVALLGCDLKMEREQNDIVACLEDNGFTVMQLQDCKDYDDYLSLGSAEYFITTYPNAERAIGRTAKRLGRKFMYMPAHLDDEHIKNELKEIADMTGISGFDIEDSAREAKTELKRVRELIGDTEIAIDYIAHTEPCGVARLLFENGFNVKRIYLDAVAADDKDNENWIKENGSGIEFIPTITPETRVAKKGDGRALAIGPKAAWAEDTKHFVNIIEGGGLFGYRGIIALARLIEDAYINEKNTRDIVPRKAVGLMSCCSTPDWR
ncbi:MAG: nitrogenase [Lachnospiraceae bacterium]|nr:nitrogenase [Lachnospiraceae bacterium]